MSEIDNDDYIAPEFEDNEDDDSILEHHSIVPQDKLLDLKKIEARKQAKILRENQKKREAVIITIDGSAKLASQLTLVEQQHEVIRCATDPIYFIETYLTVFDQTKNNGYGEIVPFIDFLKERSVITNKYRQGGISTCTCAYIAWYVSFNNNRTAAIVADKLSTAKDELMNDVVEFIESCPKWLVPRTGKGIEKGDKDLKSTQNLKRYDNGSSLGSFAAKSGLRGTTPTLLFWDETAWTEKGYKFWTAAKPVLSTGGRVIMISTPSGMDEVFYKTFDGALKGENTFKAVELYWFTDPRYNIDLVWLKNKGRTNELKIIDENWRRDLNLKMMVGKHHHLGLKTKLKMLMVI